MRAILAPVSIAAALLAANPASAKRAKRLPPEPVATRGTCWASYYSHGNKVASGRRFSPHGMTAAHRWLPFGTKVRVTHGSRSVVVTVNDRGPFIPGRCLDLALGAARAVGMINGGVVRVTYEVLP